MRNLQNELAEARNRVCELNAEFVKGLDKDFALLQERRNRRVEDGRSWQELFKGMNIDFSKVLEHDVADAKKVEETLRQVKSSLQVTPKEVSLQADDRARIDEILAAAPVWGNSIYRRFFINTAIAGLEKVGVYQIESSKGTVEGDCGDITYGSGYPNEMMPRSVAVGGGLGFDDINDITVTCSLWFLIPREYIPQPGSLSVSPYFDMHGYYWARANNGFGTYKFANVEFWTTTTLYPYNGPATSSLWHALGFYGQNVDESGRFDYTGYNSAARASLNVVGDEPVLVQVVVKLISVAHGGGSIGLLDFQTGEGNAIKIPNLLCVFNQPVFVP